MLSGERSESLQRGSGAKARFLRWEIAESQPEKRHVISTLGPVTVNFVIELAVPIRHGEQGVALFNGDRQLMCARAEQNLCLESGIHVFSYSLPSLPLRPPPSQRQATICASNEYL